MKHERLGSSETNSIESALLRTSRTKCTCCGQFMVSLPGRTIGSPSRALEAPTGVLTSGHLLLTLLTWRGPCGSVWLSGFSAREECSLGPALKTLAGKVSMQLSQASSSACWCQPQKEGQEDRGRAGQLCWHPKDPQRFLCLPF